MNVRRRVNAYAVAVVAGAAGFVLPAIALAGSGGAGLGSSGTSSSKASQSAKMGVVQPGNSKVSADGNGIALSTHVSGFLSRDMSFSGRLWSGGAGHTVEIERYGHETGYHWEPTAHARVNSHGSFAVVWHVNHIGRFQFRAVLVSHGASAADASPSLTATVYRLSVSTYYAGPWGSTTACGERLEPQTLGVANRTLPCGTPVAFYFGGRTIVVRVIDRGPYGPADWDLTEATAHKLGFSGRQTVGAVSLPRSH